MKKRPLITCLIVSLIILFSIATISAITGRMGNSRMVLRLDVGETAERYILIENVNDVPISITLIASGDLTDDLELREESFALEPGESKKAYFTIKATKEGTTETKINVMFTPQGGSGVGLTATIIVITSGESSDDNADTNSEDDETEDDNSGFSFNPNGISQNNSSSGFNLSPLMFLLISSIVLIIIFIALLVYANKVNTKKRARRPRE